MTTQIRDTQFGHVVRFLSRRRLLRYSDEIDASMYKSSIPSKLEQGADVQIQERDVQAIGRRANAEEADKQQGDREDAHTSPTCQSEKDVLLVNWYGPDDPEVCIANPVSTDVTHMQPESTELVSQLEASSDLSNLHSQLRSLFCELHIRPGRVKFDGRI